MSKRIIHLIVGAFVLLICASLAFGAAADKEKGQGVAKTTTNDDYKAFTVNNIFNYYSNNGDGSYNKYSSNSALEFPKGGGVTAIFEDGVVWGGFHKGRENPKVGGSVYRHGLQAGRILTPGGATESEIAVADDPLNAIYRVYRVRPDVGPTAQFSDVESSLEGEAELISRYEATTAQKLFDAYIKDWNEWPGKGSATDPLGLAPFQDVNGNGTYEPATDIPGQPGSDQSLYYVSNDLNPTLSQNLAGCPPIGLEVHRTFWGYNRQGALGSTIFGSTIIINKSGAPVDSMYMVQWADPDLGDAGDDYAGCDRDRGLGFVYNGRPVDGLYGAQCPSAGYDFFQGPIVAGGETDSAVFQLKYRHGFKNLGMSTFVFFSQGFAAYADPAQGPNGDVQWYRLMNGYTAAAGNEFLNPVTGLATKFTLDGDPVTGQGWLDGMAGLSPQDRRICLVTGPFTMANGDTQELVVATLAGLGGDRISSVAVLKWYSDLAQFAYNSLFNIPTPPPSPKVAVAALDQQIGLSWGDPTNYTPLEATNSGGYAFEGYNVYQMPENTFERNSAKLLATYDVVNAITTVFDDQYDNATGYVLKKPVQFGTDAGIRRAFSTKNDALNSRGLVNGTTYYFAVTAYAVNTDPLAKPTYLESSPQVLQIVPQSPVPGTRPVAFGDTLDAIQIALPGGSISEGQVIPIVVDPSKTTGHQYRVNFRTITEDEHDVTVWDLTDVTANKLIISGFRNQDGDEDYPVIDGMLVKVTGPATPGMKDWDIPNGERRWTWADADWGAEGFEGAMGNAYDQWFSGSTVTYDKLRNVLIKLAAADGTWDPRVQPADPNFSRGYRYLRGASSTPAKPEFAEWIVNPTAGYAYQDYNWGVPFSAWNVENDPPTRLMVGHHENNVAAGIVDGRYWPPANGVDLDNTVVREFFLIFDVPYSETPDPALQVDALNNTLPMMWFGCPNRRGGANFSAGDEFLILASHLNTPSNVFTFTAPAPVSVSSALATADVEKVNVYPNPYIGFNPLEANKYERFVTFTHLPAKATVRIFNLAGILIRTLQKQDPTQFFRWDLRNEDGFPVAAGMYVAYIDMPEVGKTKILKLGVIPEQQFIDRW